MKISLSSPDISRHDQEAVMEVLKTSHLALGPKLKEFEDNFSRYVGTKYAVAVNSGTSGLHLLVRALGVKEGDEVITTPFSFVASSNCILYEKAKPVFVDIDPETLNIDPKKLEKAVNKKTKAIVAVDIFGQPADWDSILKIAKKHKLKIIEDSCESLGAEYKDRKCGTFGEAAVFAFYPNKQMTTGEGGMIVTNNKKIADSCRSMANQGRQVKNGKWLEHFQLGYNYRLSDINAALGISQLKRINQIIGKRDKVASTYNRYLSGIADLKIPYSASWAKRSWFVYVVVLSDKYSHLDRDKIIKKMREVGIQCSDYFHSIHLQPFYRQLFGYKKGDFPVTESISERTIALPFYNNMSDHQIKHVVKNLKRFMLE